MSQIYKFSGMLNNQKMSDIDEIRRTNIRLLEKEAGSPSLAADRVGMSYAQYLNLRDGAKDSKTGKKRGMRKETAWKFEEAFNKTRGWLDIDQASNPVLTSTEPTNGYQSPKVRKLPNKNEKAISELLVICEGMSEQGIFELLGQARLLAKLHSKAKANPAS